MFSLLLLLTSCEDRVAHNPTLVMGRPLAISRADSVSYEMLMHLRPEGNIDSINYLVSTKRYGLVYPRETDTSFWNRVTLQSDFWVEIRTDDLNLASVEEILLNDKKVKVTSVAVDLKLFGFPSLAKAISNWTQMGITIGSSIVMLLLWFIFHFRRNKQSAEWHKKAEGDHGKDLVIRRSLLDDLSADIGVFFLVLALLFWAATGVIELGNSTSKDAFIRVFSLCNNTAFLLALPYFKYGVSHFANWKKFYTVIGISLALVTLYVLYRVALEENFTGLKTFDRLYSVTILLIIGGHMVASFIKRQHETIAIVTGLVVLTVIYGQVAAPLSLSAPYPVAHTVAYHTSYYLFLLLLVGMTFTWYSEEITAQIKSDFLTLQAIFQEDAPMEEKCKQAEMALARGEVEQVLSAFLSAPGTDKDTRHGWINLSARYQMVRKEHRFGLIPTVEYTIEYNRIVQAVKDEITLWCKRDN